eukprot:GHVO01039705.1.p1 GENE.GHVO01039705.1~~GHVO01039705.1.p1  ORF type:complete len:273 (-),score=35.36 GHVO01039705.1:23-841(-)
MTAVTNNEKYISIHLPPPSFTQTYPASKSTSQKHSPSSPYQSAPCRSPSLHPSAYDSLATQSAAQFKSILSTNSWDSNRYTQSPLASPILNSNTDYQGLRSGAGTDTRRTDTNNSQRRHFGSTTDGPLTSHTSSGNPHDTFNTDKSSQRTNPQSTFNTDQLSELLASNRQCTSIPTPHANRIFISTTDITDRSQYPTCQNGNSHVMLNQPTSQNGNSYTPVLNQPMSQNGNSYTPVLNRHMSQNGNSYTRVQAHPRSQNVPPPPDPPTHPES